MSIKGLWSVRLIHPYFFGPPLYSVVALGNKLLVEETIEKMVDGALEEIRGVENDSE